MKEPSIKKRAAQFRKWLKNVIKGYNPMEADKILGEFDAVAGAADDPQGMAPVQYVFLGQPETQGDPTPPDQTDNAITQP